MKIPTLLEVLTYFNTKEFTIELNLIENSEFDDKCNGYKCNNEQLIICDSSGNIKFYIKDWETDDEILNNLKIYKERHE